MISPRLQIHQAAAAIRRRWSRKPTAGVILGTGLGGLADHIQTDQSIDYREIPHFTPSTALSHRGQLVCGMLAGKPVIVLDGRCHFYEGCSPDQLALPVHVLHELGIGVLILSNASGGLNPGFAASDVMLVDDHIDLMFCRPAGASADPDRPPRRSGIRPYDLRLIEQAQAAARRADFVAHRGVYAAVTGPNFETRAEYRFLRKIGADAVGMSTVPEAVAAQRCGLRTLAISVITNVARPDRQNVVQPDNVVAVAEVAEDKVRALAVNCVASS
jgi:purine-nucleoside phosphorylase